MRRAILALVIIIMTMTAHAAAQSSRYFYSGNGKISISSKAGGSFSGQYRNPNGTYNKAAMKAINRVFQAKFGDPRTQISPRLIEFLNFLTDKLKPGAHITIASGWRNPEYNTKLRKSGKLAAKASLHQYGMACDMRIEGVSSKDVWSFVKELKFGGAGFYHGALAHVDVGPARSWDEATSGVGTDISEENKLIAVVTDRDIYSPGETVSLRFIRMTAFPIGVSPEFVLEQIEKNGDAKKILSVRSLPETKHGESCPAFFDILQMANFELSLPEKIQPGRYRIRATFCNKAFDAMPPAVTTPEFEVQ